MDTEEARGLAGGVQLPGVLRDRWYQKDRDSRPSRSDWRVGTRSERHGGRWNGWMEGGREAKGV